MIFQVAFQVASPLLHVALCFLGVIPAKETAFREEEKTKNSPIPSGSALVVSVVDGALVVP